jgi:hypothetical protein
MAPPSKSLNFPPAHVVGVVGETGRRRMPFSPPSSCHLSAISGWEIQWQIPVAGVPPPLGHTSVTPSNRGASSVWAALGPSVASAELLPTVARCTYRPKLNFTGLANV